MPVKLRRQREKEELFRDTLADLRTRLRAPTRYDMTQAAGLMRRLLLDASPLYQQVNRHYRLDVRFWMPTFDARPDLNHSLGPSVSLSQLFATLDPEFRDPKCPKAHRPLKEFLRYVPAWSRVAELTIREIILHEAHVHGGVHAGESETGFDKAADKLNLMMSSSDFRLTLQHLVYISKCVIHAMEPLEKATLPAT